MGTNIFAFVIVLGILIFFHELGHFIVARFFGVGVEKFSLGFGPRLFGKTVGETDYRISAIPLGGYVKMTGEDPGADIDPADIPRSFTHKHVFKRMLIVAAGPLFNILLALLIIMMIYMISGVYILKPTVGSVGKNTPAERQGLKSGDQIIAIDQVRLENWEEMARMITDSKGKALVFSVLREGQLLTLHITAELQTAKNLFGEDVDRYLIGIGPSGDSFHKTIGLVGAVTESVKQTYQITELTVISIVKMIQGSLSRETLGGPIMIAQMAGEQVKEGAANFFFFIALLSINLGIINFLPIPVLDGGHLLFFSIEAILGRPVNTRMREIAQQIGIFLLLLLMIYVFYNDITRLIFS
ncbi:MAG: RIP metalloprotease RseP [Desulfobacterales bacterium]|jgi:regulator of sigma E protease|nr:RIP metalloprotease RseP [Desulfobacterales bacterium]